MVDVNWNKIPPLTTLRAFEATARLQGYSAAARSLNVTPAAIAQQVRKLEIELGTSLVRRDGRGLVLTEAGQQLALPLREAFAQIAQSIDDMKLREASRGVRVSTTDFFVNAVVLPGLGDFWKQHPTLQVSFSPEGNTQPVDLENFDVVVRGGPPGQTWDGFESIALLETPIIICGAPSLVGAGDVNLSTLPWIKDHSMGGAVFENVVRQAGFDPDKIEIVDPGSAKLEPDAALMGYGLHVSPELTVRPYLSQGSLLWVDVPLDMAAVYYAVYRKGLLAEPVKLFLDWLVELCRPLSYSPEAS